jgi:hypothetical protein
MLPFYAKCQTRLRKHRVGIASTMTKLACADTHSCAPPLCCANPGTNFFFWLCTCLTVRGSFELKITLWFLAHKRRIYGPKLTWSCSMYASSAHPTRQAWTAAACWFGGNERTTTFALEGAQASRRYLFRRTLWTLKIIQIIFSSLIWSRFEGYFVLFKV